MIIRCPTCASNQTRLTGKTHYWIDADGGWNYHECQCLDCGALMVLDEKGLPHVLGEKPAPFDTPLTLSNRGAHA